MKRLLVVACVCMFVTSHLGCSPSSKPAPISTTAVVKEAVPGRIEITDASVKIDQENVARIQVKYKFVEGAPTKFYQCLFTFPGTEKTALKPLESWEMKPEGIIVTGTEAGEHKLDEFTVQFSEADSPDQGFHPNSELFKGKVSR